MTAGHSGDPDLGAATVILAKRFGRFGDYIERFYDNSLNVDLLEAIVSGLVTGAALTFLKLIADMKISVYYALASVGLPTVCLYLAAALLLNRFWQGDLRRLVPSWFLIPVLGAAFSLMLYSIPAILSGWSDPFTDKSSTLVYVMNRLKLARMPFLLINVSTWPITLAIHLFGPIIKWTRT